MEVFVIFLQSTALTPDAGGCRQPGMQKQSGELASEVRDQLVFVVPNYSACLSRNIIEVIDLTKVSNGADVISNLHYI